MFVSSLDRAGVRKLLDQIPTDADFDAFCLDFFPEVQARFTCGMDRVQKTTLLLQLESDCARIAEKLRLRFANPATGTPVRGRPNSKRLSGLGLVGVGVALLVAAGLLVYRISGKAPERVATPISTPLPSSSPTGPASNLSPPNPPPAGGRLTVEHAGDIHTQGRVNITAPLGAQETMVKTSGQIESGGDVNIGVTSPADPSSVPREKVARP